MTELNLEESKIPLGDRMKSYEKTSIVPPYQSFIVRADGNCFSKFTNGFPKPFDEGFNRAMTLTANAVMNHFNARTVFVCSDEITLIFGSVCTKEEFENPNVQKSTHIYGGRHNKIESLVSAKCSVLFNKFMLFMLEEVNAKPNVYNDKVKEKVNRCDAIFDARLVPIPLDNEIEIVNNIIWRSTYDCYRNTVSSYGRHKLGNKRCQNMNCNDMIVMMKNEGFDFNTQVPTQYKYGTLCKKILVKFKNKNDNGSETEYERSKEYNFSLNLLTQDRDKTLELFLDKYYSDKIECTKIEL